MDLNYKTLKKTYIDLFQNNEKCDHVLTDVLFAFNEFYSFIEDSKTKNILEIGSGTGILLKELAKYLKIKIFTDLIHIKKVLMNTKMFLKTFQTII